MIAHRAFGVEQEHFAFHGDGTPPSPDEINQLWRQLLESGFQVRAQDGEGNIVSIEKLTESGPIVATNDSCTHILEVAFPPLRDLRLFRQMYLDVWGELKNYLDVQGITLRGGGALPSRPSEIFWRPKETDLDGARLKKFFQRTQISHPLFVDAFPACFAATHVNLEIPQLDAIEWLPDLYACEYIIPLHFSNSFEFQGQKAHCIRLPAWLANFQKPYPLLGVPDPMPRTLAEYHYLQLQSPLRDYSFIAIRSPHRVEFRAACSQNSIDEILQLIQFRLNVVDALSRGCRAVWGQPSHLLECCRTGISPVGVEPWFEQIIAELPKYSSGRSHVMNCLPVR